MWDRLNKISNIADKVFYGIISLLVLILGLFGAVVIHRTLSDRMQEMEKGVRLTSAYMERELPPSLRNLDAKRMRQVIDEAASDELQAVEIFDEQGDRIYVYERSMGGRSTYDRSFERDLVFEGKPVGRMKAYFSLEASMSRLRTREFLRLILLISVAGIVLGGGLYILMRRLVLSPIAGTLKFSEGLTGGDYARRIRVDSGDEMGRLQESLNRMADSMQESVETLKASYLEAEGARRKADEASQLKSRFLANMSHEIRTPLHAILGYADLLLEEEGSPEKRKSLETILTSGRILLDLIQEVLDFSKIESSREDLNLTDFSLEELVEEITPIVTMRLQGKEVVFKSHLDQGLKGLWRGDKVRLRQVLLNLLVNATKYTKKGEIELRLEKSGEELLFTVRDTGIGISVEHQERIFEPFTQVDSSTTRPYGGIGLGLAIVKRLVEMMGGRIWMESAVGQGSRFYFTLGMTPMPHV